MAGLKRGYSGQPLMPYCRECGQAMNYRRGGLKNDTIFWDCPTYSDMDSFTSAIGHDSVLVEINSPPPPKFDPMTGEKLNNA